MSEFDRRHFMKMTAVAGAATGLAGVGTTTAAAADGIVNGQVPGVYRYKIGDMQCASLHDGSRSFPLPDAFVTNVPKPEVLSAAEAAYMPKGIVTVPFNPQVIVTGGKRVLIDTGNGPGAFAATNGAVGQTSKNLVAASLDPKSIDMIILSHFHPDHTNGLRNPDGSLVYPNAEILAPAKEWDFWMSEENAAKAKTSELMNSYFGNVKKTFAGIESRVNRYDWGKELAPGITSVAAPGHTPGHTAFVLSSGSSKVLLQSDVTNIPEFFLIHPDWHVSYDNDPDQAQATRHAFYDMAAAEKALVIGYHFAFPSIGHVEKAGTGYRLVPVAWNGSL